MTDRERRGLRAPARFCCIKKTIFNQEGDLIGELQEHQAKESSIDDEGRLTSTPTRETLSRSAARIRYEYDLFGNWVSRVIEGRSSVGDEFALASVERRSITYFDSP